MDLFKNACWLHLSFAINRYLMANADGRQDGHEKAQRHLELCYFYLAAFKGVDIDQARIDFIDEYLALHEHTQALTDYLDEQIGFPLKGRPDYDKLAPMFFEKFHALAMESLAALVPATTNA